MAGEAYKVVIQGVAPGRDPSSVRRALSVFFKSNPAHLDTLLSGQPVVVKKTPDKADALKFHKIFSEAGANCKVVKMVAAAGQPAAGRKAPIRKPPAQAAQPKAKTAQPKPGQAQPPQPKKKESEAPKPGFANPMTCPACDIKQEKSEECIHCGIIIAKYFKKTGKMPPEFAGLQDEEPEDDHGAVIGQHFGDEIEDPYSFWAEAPLAFVYPFKGNGLFILIAGSIFFALLGMIPIFGIYKFVIQVFTGGYLAAYMFKVVNRSADKQDDPPNWPSLVNMGEDLAAPLVRMVIPGLFCYFPAIVLAILFFVVAPVKVYDYNTEFSDQYTMPADENSPFFLYGNPEDSVEAVEEEEEVEEESSGSGFWEMLDSVDENVKLIIIGALVLIGSLYYPMSLLTVAMSGSLLALSPHIVFPAIFKTFIPYLFACFLFLFALVLKWLSDTFIAIPIPLTGPILKMFVTIFFLMVEARLLGVLYNAYAEKLGWYEDF